MRGSPMNRYDLMCQSNTYNSKSTSTDTIDDRPKLDEFQFCLYAYRKYVRIDSFSFLRRMERRFEREMGKILSGIHENDVAWD